MATFKKGEIAIIVKADEMPRVVGLECEVMTGLEHHPHFSDTWGYLVDIPGHPCPIGGYWYALPECLRKKKPPEGLGSWDEIEKICGWKPESLKEHA